MHTTDKKGQHAYPQSLLIGFARTIEECQLVELDLKGVNYTWEKSRGSSNWVRERLDRAFATVNWWQIFSLCNLTVHHTICSDHEPINLEFFSTAHSRNQFRFENTWLRENSFSEKVASFWRTLDHSHLMPKLNSVSLFMAKWGRNFFHKFRDKIKKQKVVLESFAECDKEENTRKYFEAKHQLNELLVHEEVYWKQRDKAFWLEDGDSNSKFFHAFANARKKINHVSQLKNDHGEVVFQHDDMCRIVKSNFRAVFENAEDEQDFEDDVTAVFVSTAQNEALVAEFSFKEFECAVQQMHPDKGSGPDGLNPAFYQHFWKVMGKEIFHYCKGWLADCSFPANLNDTNVVLIPKKDNADTMKDLRPIALCNVLYKFVAKVLANRLKSILPEIISEN